MLNTVPILQAAHTQWNHTTSTKLAGNDPSCPSSLPFHLSEWRLISTPLRECHETHHVSVLSLFSVMVTTWPFKKDRSPGSTARKSNSAIARATPSPCA